MRVDLDAFLQRAAVRTVLLLVGVAATMAFALLVAVTVIAWAWER